MLPEEVEQLRLIGLRKGPAPMPPGVAKDRVVGVRFNAAQLARLEALAAHESLSVSEVIRAALLVLEVAVENPGAVTKMMLDETLQVERVLTPDNRRRGRWGRANV